MNATYHNDCDCARNQNCHTHCVCECHKNHVKPNDGKYTTLCAGCGKVVAVKDTTFDGIDGEFCRECYPARKTALEIAK